jgi:D-alanyl-D-alanine carboxypeptidase
MRRWVWGVALGTIVSAVLVACGGSDNPSVTILPSESATPGSGQTATGTAESHTPDPTNDGETPTAAPTSVGTIDPAGYLPCGDLLVPVNKELGLAPDCQPNDLVALPARYTYGGEQLLRREAADALVTMLEAAARDGIEMFATSSYRSYGTQAATFDYWVRLVGIAEAERQSARPGHSEHQLGTTTDLVSASANFDLDQFAGTAEAAWVAANSWRYGYIVSYPPDTEDITGYIHEPWHIRYVGIEIAREVHESGLTLGEFLLQR